MVKSTGVHRAYDAFARLRDGALTMLGFPVCDARRTPDGWFQSGSTVRSQWPVWEPGAAATSSGRPIATISPPPEPASGPRSITQSAS